MCIDKDAKIQELEEKLKDFLSGQHYRYIGKSGIPVMARELEDSRDEWKRKAVIAMSALAHISVATSHNIDFDVNGAGVVADKALAEIEDVL